MTSDDKSAILALMLQSGFTISRLANRSIYAALCNDALHGSKVSIAIAVVEGQGAGFLLTITDWANYWRRFLLRHPVLGFRIVLGRLSRRRKIGDVWSSLPASEREFIKSCLSAEPSGRDWSESSPAIAKVVFVHVDTRFRRLRLGAGLYGFLADRLAAKGVTRLDAKVDLKNRQAIPFHALAGFRLERVGNSLFGTKDLHG
jgi:ribosomal protein S18 acetylase RimI-like enzyme